MPVSESYRTFVLDQLGRATDRVRIKSMFGGAGVYSGDLFFALIADDVLYLKAGDSNRPDFEERGMGPFRPFGEGGEVMQYYQLPEDLLEDPDALRPWVDKAVGVAAAKKSRKRGSRKTEARKAIARKPKARKPKARKTMSSKSRAKAKK